MYANYMLAFKYRFHGHGSLRYVYTHGHSVRSRLMTIKCSFHPKRQDPRVAVVISKKVIRGAVGRNRVRRRLYEIIRNEVPELKPNTDLVIIIFSGDVIDIPAAELASTTKQLLKEAGVYKTTENEQMSSI